MEACTNSDVLRVIYFGLLILDIVKIVIPIALIILGAIDFSKSVVTSDEGVQKKNVNLFIKRIMYAIIVFAVPWIVETFITVLGDLIEDDEINFTDCIINARLLGEGIDVGDYACYYQKNVGIYRWSKKSSLTASDMKYFDEASQYTSEKSCLNANTGPSGDDKNNDDGYVCLYQKSTGTYTWIHTGGGSIPRELVNEGFTESEYKNKLDCEEANRANNDKYKCYYQKSTGRYEWIYSESGATPGGSGGEFTLASQYKTHSECNAANEK